jgi:hypothetical protein
MSRLTSNLSGVTYVLNSDTLISTNSPKPGASCQRARFGSSPTEARRRGLRATPISPCPGA